ncbi:hypothetical protein CRG98_041807 [Punica granatum]|uniref:Bulb-type lectin domain-containing protein n=1 Tax=Punica granatum TaxID=22663 RepID=A0A2I0I2Y2_PUNGR|nr:hypothetical protein CRG98_041807 [Punica granatum]
MGPIPLEAEVATGSSWRQRAATEARCDWRLEPPCCIPLYNITSSKPLLRNETLISPSGIFEMGLFQANGSDNMFVRICQSDESFAVHLDNGNFALIDARSGNYTWESFHVPCDTLLPGMKIGINTKAKDQRYLVSWKNAADPSHGDFAFRVTNGILNQNYWDDGAREWVRSQESPANQCEIYGAYGPHGVCNPLTSPICHCLTGFRPKSYDEWNKGNWTGGGYMAPEYAMGGIFSEKSDVYSFGVLLLQIAWKFSEEVRGLELINEAILVDSALLSLEMPLLHRNLKPMLLSHSSFTKKATCYARYFSAMFLAKYLSMLGQYIGHAAWVQPRKSSNSNAST